MWHKIKTPNPPYFFFFLYTAGSKISSSLLVTFYEFDLTAICRQALVLIPVNFNTQSVKNKHRNKLAAFSDHVYP